MLQTVHTELSALATLYLTYLHCRPKTSQGDEEDTDMDNVSQELGLREGRRGSRRGSGSRERGQSQGHDGDVHGEYKERAGEEDEEEESLQGISIHEGSAGGNFRPQAYSSHPSQQRQQAQWQRPNQAQTQAASQGRRPSTKPSGQQASPPRQTSLAAEATMQDRSGIDSVNNYSVNSAVESAHNGVPGSPIFLRGSRPHPSNSPLPRYMQAKGAGKR